MARAFTIKLPSFFRAASPENPRTSLANPASWLTSLFAPRSKSGAEVSAETVISLSAVWRGVSIISQSIAILPFEVIEENEEGSVRAAKEHDLYFLLKNSPSKLYSSFVFIRSLIAQAIFFGNGYAIINWDRDSARPTSFKLVDQRKTTVEIFIGEDANGEEILYYKIEGKTYRADEVIHIQNIGFNGLAGHDVIKTHRDNYGLALSSRDFGNEFFRNGTFLSGYLSTDKTLNVEALKRQAKSWSSAYGGTNAAGKVAFLDEGMKFHPLNIKPADASMLETQKFNIEDVARIMGVPPHLLYALDRATFNNIEHLSQEFATYTLTPWATQLEQEFSRKIFRETEKRYTRTRRSIFQMRFDMTELMRADADSRGKLYMSGIQNGWLQPNEARKREGLNPVDGGNKNFIQMQYTTLDKAGEQVAQQQIPVQDEEETQE